MIQRYFFLTTFVVLIIPFGVMIWFLLTHLKENGKVAVLRRVILTHMIANSLIFLELLLTTVLSIFGIRPMEIHWGISVLFTLPVLSACYVNWWALYKLRQLQHHG